MSHMIMFCKKKKKNSSPESSSVRFPNAVKRFVQIAVGFDKLQTVKVRHSGLLKLEEIIELLLLLHLSLIHTQLDTEAHCVHTNSEL